MKLSPESLGGLTGMSRIHLWHCNDCGFEYSHLDQAGGGLFYEQLQRQLPNYYPTQMPEYERAINFARRHQLTEVLDITLSQQCLCLIRSLDLLHDVTRPLCNHLWKRIGETIEFFHADIAQ